jgi:hypothetical protein
MGYRGVSSIQYYWYIGYELPNSNTHIRGITPSSQAHKHTQKDRQTTISVEGSDLLARTGV